MADKPPIHPPATDLSPKERLISTPGAIGAHRDLMANAAFERGTDLALLQFIQDTTARVKDGQTAAEAGYKIAGAVEYLRQLKTISEKPVFAPFRPNDNLTQPK